MAATVALGQRSRFFCFYCDGVCLLLAGTWFAKKILPFAGFPPSPQMPHWVDSYLYNVIDSTADALQIKGVILVSGWVERL